LCIAGGLTVRYPEGVVENLMVKVKDTFILADFMVLDMEGDLGIPLILGRPFLRDTNARIDVGIAKNSLRIMGKTMKFKFQNKRELFLIHEDSEKQGLWAEPGWENWNIHHSPPEPAWEDWEIHTPPTEPVEDYQKISDFITNTIWEDLEIVYPAPEDPAPAPSTPTKKTKKVWRKKKTSSPATTSPGTDKMTST